MVVIHSVISEICSGNKVKISNYAIVGPTVLNINIAQFSVIWFTLVFTIQERWN